MKLKDAIAIRIKELCKDNNLSIHGLSIKSGVANSTLVDMAKANNESVQVKFIYEICAGLNISFAQFFKSPLFDIENITD